MIGVTEDGPGQALLRIEGAAAAAGQPGFRVERDAEWTEHTLGPNGWQSSDALLLPLRASVDGADLLLTVGWDVCRYLESGVYLISLPAAGLEPTGAYWPDVAPVAPVAPVAVTAVPPPPPAAPPPPPPSSPAPAPIPELVQPVADPVTPFPDPSAPTTRSLAGPLIGLAILLIAAGGAAWYFLHDHAPTDPVRPVIVVPEPAPPIVAPPAPPPAPQPAPPVIVPPVPPPPAPPPPPLDLTTLSVPDVLARAPNVGAIVTEGQRRLRTDKKDDGLLLLEAAADRGDPAAAAAIARLYDPVGFQPGGPIPRPDPRQAARYYRDAARGNQDVAAPRAALRQLLETQKSRGDFTAELILKDFWP